MLQEKGKYSIRIVAQHRPSNILTPYPTLAEEKELFSRDHTRDQTLAPTYLDFAIDQTVMLNRNIATSLGLNNGSMGTIVAFGFHQNNATKTQTIQPFPEIGKMYLLHPNRYTPIVFVRFNKLTTTDNTYSAMRNISNVIPIVAEAHRKSFRVNGKNYYRWQLPLQPAAAITTHKAQSMTAKHGAVLIPSPPGIDPFARSLAYVQISRVTRISNDNLLLLHPLQQRHFNHPRHEKERKQVKDEYIRLEQKYIK